MLSGGVRREANATAVALRALFRNGPLRTVLLAFVLFSAVELGTWVAMLLYAYERLGPASVGVVALAQLLPAGILAPLAASLADRHDRRRVLAGSYALQAAALGMTAAGILGGAPPLLVIAASTVSVGAMTLTRPAQGALLPMLGRTPGEVAGANGIAGGAEGIGMLAGPLVAAAILLVGGPGEVLLAGALATVLATALVIVGPRRVVRTEVLGPPAGPPEGHTSILAGIRLVRANRDTRLIVGLLALRRLVSGALDVLFVLLAIEVLGTGGSGAGVLNAALGVGTLVGGAAAFALIGRPRLAPALGLTATLFGLGVIAAGLPVNVALVAFLIALAGIGSAGMDVAGRTILQRATPDHVLGRVLGSLEGSGLVAVAVGSVLVAPVVAVTSVQVAVIVTGVVLVLGVAAAWQGLRRIDATVRVPVREIAVLRAVPAFAPLPPPQLEGVAARARWQTAEPGDAVIREGEPGDRYYVLESGRVRVTQGGIEVNIQGAGEGFGEVALLRNIARTATVTALEPCVMLTLERHDFLEVVTGHEQVRVAVEQTASGWSTPPGS